jgi:sugar lactone lactonase YvrE
MADIEFVTAIRTGAALGECAIWDDTRQEFLCTDIEGRALYRWNWATQQSTRLGLPDRLGSFALIEGSDWLVAAAEKSFHLLSRATGERRELARVEEGWPYTRLNDGRADRQGRFWAGTMAEQRPAPDGSSGSLYCLAPGQPPRPTLSGVMISNSLCWSPDGDRMYFADSLSNLIRAYRFEPDSGTLNDGEDFARTPKGVHPDGSCVDAQGGLWNAQWGASQVVRYTPDGRIETVLKLPCSQPSCIAFGGPDLDHIFITTARVDLSAEALASEPLAGDVLVYKTGYRGLRESLASKAFLAALA